MVMMREEEKKRKERPFIGRLCIARPVKGKKAGRKGQKWPELTGKIPIIPLHRPHCGGGECLSRTEVYLSRRAEGCRVCSPGRINTWFKRT
jgi:hypothetical protein